MWIWFLFSSVSCALFCGPAFLVLKHCGLIDRPNQRSSHDRPTVRGGGIVVLGVIGIFGAWSMRDRMGAELPWIALGGMALAAISFCDDIRSVSRIVRLAVQIGAAIVALAAISLKVPANSGTAIGGWGLVAG